MIYFDHAATSPPLTKALEENAAALTEEFYNPSALYGGGRRAHARLEAARKTVLGLVGGEKDELIFTSCGTESDNAAVFGAARRGNAVATLGEHAAVDAAMKELSARGVEVRFAPLLGDGSVDPEALLSLVDGETSLVSVVHVNNETGAINDVAALAAAVKAKNPRAAFLSDGVQAFGKIPFRIPSEIDFYSISAHKIGGVRGIGGLFRKKTAKFHPLVFGGGQESGLRSGTENVFGASVLASAAALRYASIEENFAAAVRRRQLLKDSLDPSLFRILSPENGSPYILSVSAEGLKGEVLQRMIEERGFLVGTGSACSSKKPHSRVLAACRYPASVLGGVLRVSFAPESAESDAAELARVMNETAAKLKKVI